MEMIAMTKVHGPKSVVTEMDGYTLITEPPVAAGGSGQYPPATRMVVAALLNCIFSGFKSFCEKREIPTDSLMMEFHGDLEDGIYKAMELSLHLPQEFPEKYKDALGRVLETCAVKKIIKNIPNIYLNID